MLVIFNIIDLGEAKEPVFKITNARSVDVEVPLPKLYKAPPVGAVPEEKAVAVVAVVPVVQLGPNANPVGKVAVALVPIPLKFCAYKVCIAPITGKIPETFNVCATSDAAL